ncbi:MAG TPA: NUDIX hydrolase [Beijerinckiaceae bacterium]|nr:NUDIX hydrolase [Beijerinckiaceae bacterium]
MKKAGVKMRVQYAALPYRTDEEAVEILLVTSLGTKRWIIPKGWPMNGREPHEAAAREALEEAGVVGTVGAEAIGTYSYEKRRKSGASVPCNVEVFPLDVGTQRKRWREKGRREVKWLPVEEAAKTVSDAGLGELILAWSRRRRAAEPAATE